MPKSIFAALIDVAVMSVDQNKVWGYFGLAAGTFTDPTVGTITPIRAAHVTEACAALR